MARSTDWEARYVAGDTPWDKAAHAPPLDEIDTSYFKGRVLVPGCGYGYDVRKVSRSDNTVIGLDLAESAITVARKHPVVGNEEYLAGNLFALSEDFRSSFDAVLEHTCFCAIQPADRVAYQQSVIAALKPGGLLIAIFYIDPGHEEGPPFPVSHQELDDLFGPHFNLEKAWVPQSSFPGREGREQIRLYRLR